MKKLSKVFALSIISVTALGQTSVYYPNTFSTYFNNMSQITPAFVPEQGKADLAAGYTSPVGAFKKIAGYYFTAACIFRNNSENVRVFRLQFSNEKDGAYITSPRIYANYAYSLYLTENLEVFSGVAAGVVGTYYSAPSTQSTTSTLPDGSLGAGIKWRKLIVGGSVLQVLNSKSIPFISTIVLHQYYNAYISLKKDWPNTWSLKGYTLYSYFPCLSQELNLAIALSPDEMFTLGTTYKYDKAFSVFITMIVDMNEDDLELSLNYNTPWSRSLVFQNNLEICLRYILN